MRGGSSESIIFQVQDKSWGPNAQYCDYGEKHYIMHLKVAKKIDFKYPHHTQRKTQVVIDDVMDVSYCGNYFITYVYIKSSHKRP